MKALIILLFGTGAVGISVFSFGAAERSKRKYEGAELFSAWTSGLSAGFGFGAGGVIAIVWGLIELWLLVF